MEWKENAERWSNFSGLESELKKQLSQLDEKSLEDSFFKDIDFGTGGMRGELGPGTNRINIYTIRKATEGLAQFILASGEEAVKKGVVVAYDSRHKSSQFALEIAKVLGVHHIKTYLFDELKPTPLLSFAVRYVKAYAGIVVTASHNPAEYNGYKIYNEDGGQIPPLEAQSILKFMNQVDNELMIKTLSTKELLESNLLEYLTNEVEESYLQEVKKLILNPIMVNKLSKDLKIVYTPLCGAGLGLLKKALESSGYEQLVLVKEQSNPDSTFSSVSSMNPEEPIAFDKAIEYGEANDSDILLATDPDADRLGVAVRNHKDQYVILTGNQIGALMLEYLLHEKARRKELGTNAIIVKTIVTSDIGRSIANKYGVDTVDTLTGFKFIGEKIKEFECEGNQQFLFGYEESYGYLIGDFVRDKDAIQAAAFLCEVACYYKNMGKNLYDGLLSIFETYGFYEEALVSITLKGIEGIAEMEDMMTYLRTYPLHKIGNEKVQVIEDYLFSQSKNLYDGLVMTILLPSSNVLKYKLANGSWICVRPSGTEPKIKFYFGVKSEHQKESVELLENLKNHFMQFINQLANQSK